MGSNKNSSLMMKFEDNSDKSNIIKAEDLGKNFDRGEVDINDYLDLSSGFRPDRRYPNPHVKKLLQRGQDLF
jgi:hypothetical protein